MMWYKVDYRKVRELVHFVDVKKAYGTVWLA